MELDLFCFRGSICLLLKHGQWFFFRSFLYFCFALFSVILCILIEKTSKPINGLRGLFPSGKENKVLLIDVIRYKYQSVTMLTYVSDKIFEK